MAPSSIYEIETKRLRLAPFAEEDLETRVKLANDLQVARNIASMPHPYTRKDAAGWVDGHDAARAAGTDFPFAVSVKGEGLIGSIALNSKEGSMLDLGYWFGRKYWGQGFATEAAKAILHWAERERGIKAVTAGFFADNPASGRVLSKVGFLRTGTTRQTYSKGRQATATSIDMIWLGQT
jgi:RimJ/RimL family protein N-acetyltransferase